MDVLDVTATVIGYATSTNGITWTVTSSEALSGDSSALWDSVGIPCVIKDGDTYKMWYTQGISYLTPEDLEGTYRVELEIDGRLEGTGVIRLAGGKSWPVTFTVRKDVAGTYIADVDRLSGTFVVKGVSPAALPPTTPPVTPPPEPPAQANGWLIGSIIAAVATGITVPLILRQRRKRV